MIAFSIYLCCLLNVYKRPLLPTFASCAATSVPLRPAFTTTISYYFARPLWLSPSFALSLGFLPRPSFYADVLFMHDTFRTCLQSHISAISLSHRREAPTIYRLYQSYSLWGSSVYKNISISSNALLTVEIFSLRIFNPLTFYLIIRPSPWHFFLC